MSGSPDTFEGAAQPVVDNDLTALAGALDKFHAVTTDMARHQSVQRDKALHDQHLAQWESFKSTMGTGEIVDAIRSGKVGYQADPYIAAVVNQDVATMEAKTLASSLDEQIKGGKVSGFGTENFDADGYVRGQAAAYMQKWGHVPGVMAKFGQHLDTIRESVVHQHQAVLGQNQTAAMETAARNYLNSAFEGAIVNDHLSGQALSDRIRSLYGDIGLRTKKGSLDLKNGRIDDLLMDVLQHHAKDPEYALQVMDVLTAPRKDAGGQDLGPLAAVASRTDAAEAIRKTAQAALSKEESIRTKQAVLETNVQRMLANDGSYPAFLSDFEEQSQFDPEKKIKMSKAEQEREAVNEAFKRIREKNGGQQNLDEELKLILNNEIVDNPYLSMLKSASVTMMTSAGNPQQMQQIVEAGQLYNKIADVNSSYLHEHLKERAAPFEAYTVLTRDGQYAPQEAAAMVAQGFGSEQVKHSPDVLKRHQDKLDTVTRSFDLHPYIPWYGTVSNTSEVRERTMRLARELIKVEAIDPDTAIQHASARIVQSATMLNGRAVFAPGFGAAEADAAKFKLNEIFENNKDRLGNLGVSSGSHLSVIPERGGIYRLAKWDEGFVTVADPKDGILKVPTFTSKDIQQWKSEMEAKKAADAKAQDIKERADNAAKIEFDKSAFNPETTLKALVTPIKEYFGRKMANDARDNWVPPWDLRKLKSGQISHEDFDKWYGKGRADSLLNGK